MICHVFELFLIEENFGFKGELSFYLKQFKQKINIKNTRLKVNK